MQRLRRHLTYANVAATLALVIAVAGGATAIAGGKAAKNQRGKQLDSSRTTSPQVTWPAFGWCR